MKKRVSVVWQIFTCYKCFFNQYIEIFLIVAVLVAPVLVIVFIQVIAFPLKLTTETIENEVGQFAVHSASTNCCSRIYQQQKHT